MTRVLKVKVGSKWFTVEVDDLTTSPIRVLVDGEPVDVEIDGAPTESSEVEQAEQAAEESPATPDATTPAPTPVAAQPAGPSSEISHTIRAPMPGVIISVSHTVGGSIRVGDEACVLEAMKMQQSIRSDGEGTIARILVQPGQQVRGGEALIELS